MITIFSPLRIFLPVSAAAFLAGAATPAWTIATQSHVTNSSVLLILLSVVIFLVGLVSEQISVPAVRGPTGVTSTVGDAYTGCAMRTTKRIAMSALALLTMLGVGSTASAQQVQLAMRNGRVSLVAKDATVRQILAEWARIGQTKVVNLERIPGGPITIELTNVSEDEALDVLLRSVSGYMTAPRPTPVAGLSGTIASW